MVFRYKNNSQRTNVPLAWLSWRWYNMLVKSLVDTISGIAYGKPVSVGAGAGFFVFNWNHFGDFTGMA